MITKGTGSTPLEDGDGNATFYEEGSWTPTYESTGASFTYDGLTGGRYRKLGNLVFVQGNLRTDSKSGGTAGNNVNIGGLPFTASTGQDGYSALTITSASSFTDDMPLVGRIVGGNSIAELLVRQTADSGTENLTYSDLSGGTLDNVIRFAGVYSI